MRPVNPTVTWPNHTTLITGVTPAKHGVLFNGLLRRDPGVPPVVEPWLPRDRDGPRQDPLRHRARTRLDDGAGGLGGDSGRADRDLGVSRTACARWPDRAGARQGRRTVAGGARDVCHTQHHLARSHLDRGGGAHHPRAQAEPDDVSPAQSRLHAASIRSAHARRHDDDGAPRCAGRARSSPRSNGPD